MVITNSKVPHYLSLVINAYAIALWPFIFIRDEGDETTINHEKIHLRQQAEMLVIGFYLFYAFFWVKSFLKHRDKARAYYDIPFEKEAYAAQDNTEYLSERRFFEWINYL